LFMNYEWWIDFNWILWKVCCISFLCWIELTLLCMNSYFYFWQIFWRNSWASKKNPETFQNVCCRKNLEQIGLAYPRPGWSDWANFRPLAFVYFVQFFDNYRSSANISAFSTVQVVNWIWHKNGLGYILGHIFSKLIRSPCPRRPILKTSTVT
jgi:hypothetical protein